MQKHRHGGPFDRGSADAWYERSPKPHYYEGATYTTRLFNQNEMTKQQITEYWEGFQSVTETKYSNDPFMMGS